MDSAHGITQAIRDSVVEHPKVSPDLLRAVCVMCEEAGEALQAALDYTRNGRHYPADLLHLVQEVEQCGAAAHRLLDEKLYALVLEMQREHRREI